MATVRDIVEAVDRLAPFRLAEEWDNVGLLLGDAAWPVRRVLVSLDVTETVCDEAERLEADWSLFEWVDMIEELKAIFGCEVDLVSKGGLRNPFRRRAILSTRKVVYGA